MKNIEKMVMLTEWSQKTSDVWFTTATPQQACSWFQSQLELLRSEVAGLTMPVVIDIYWQMRSDKESPQATNVSNEIEVWRAESRRNLRRRRYPVEK